MTVGKLGSLAIQTIPAAEIDEFLNWIHSGTPQSEIDAIVSEYRLREQLGWMPRPIEVRSDQQPVAGVYFTTLPGDLAMLGAIRADQGSETLVAQLMVSQLQQIRTHLPACHIQAATEHADNRTQSLIKLAGFQLLTEVQQLWLGIDNQQFLQGSDPSSTKSPALTGRLSWRPAADLTCRRFQELLGATFEGTLDCPELNGVRTHAQVLKSFLVGKPFRVGSSNWSTVWLDGQLAGCLMLTPHNRELVELAYMGLVPAARGKRLGRYLIEMAMRQAIQWGATMLVVAVDSRNTPALQLYQRSGFHFHRRLRVYWYR